MKLMILIKNFYKLFKINIYKKKYYLVTIISNDFIFINNVICKIHNLLIRTFVAREKLQTRLILLLRNHIEIEWDHVFIFTENNINNSNMCFYGDSVVKSNNRNWYESRPNWSPIFASYCDYVGEVLVIKSKLAFGDNFSVNKSFTDTIKELTLKDFTISKSNESLYTIHEERISDVYQLGKLEDTNTITKSVSLSVVIPTKLSQADDNLLVVNCLTSLFLNLPKLVNLEIVVILNEQDFEKKDLISNNLPSDFNLKYIKTTGRFNYSKSINSGIKETSNEIILVLNDDIKFTSKINLQHIFQHFAVANISILGFNLVYPDLIIQHAGLEYREGEPQHFLKGSELAFLYPSHFICREVSGVTAACCFIRKSDFENIGCFDESFSNDYNDVDLMLRLNNIGIKSILCNEIVAIHFESQTRGITPTTEIRESLSRLIKKHGELPKRDPFLYTPFENKKVNNLSLLEERNLTSGQH
jgi:GT2 family glycosyltransferase